MREAPITANRSKGRDAKPRGYSANKPRQASRAAERSTKRGITCVRRSSTAAIAAGSNRASRSFASSHSANCGRCHSSVGRLRRSRAAALNRVSYQTQERDAGATSAVGADSSGDVKGKILIVKSEPSSSPRRHHRVRRLVGNQPQSGLRSPRVCSVWWHSVTMPAGWSGFAVGIQANKRLKSALQFVGSDRVRG
jgi:hypothetical protein